MIYVYVFDLLILHKKKKKKKKLDSERTWWDTEQAIYEFKQDIWVHLSSDVSNITAYFDRKSFFALHLNWKK